VAVNSIYASIIPSHKYNLILKSFSYGTQVMGHPVQGDSSFTAGGKIDLTNYDFTFIFCRHNLLSIRHIISKNEIFKLIRSNFAIFSIINCLIYSTQVFSHNLSMLN
jgi:hypothetical protein